MLRINKMFCLRGWTVVLALLTTVGATAARPQAGAANDVAVLTVKGEVKQELRLSAADLKAMPRVKVTAKDHDGVAREHEGVALQTLLAKAGVPQGAELRGKNMTLIVVAEATDGYRAAFSLAELDSDFAGAQVLVADLVDGKPLDAQHGPLRLVVPGDKHQGRWVRLLKNISVQKAAESR
ncbi:MAG TPA: molybdopterin-dependent oxidoreductase [Candidatus Acidoferrales bacterium]|nr:molybdopterin-dependent oxidoreductase [Candidatus Acidoferrales bacterium]